MLVKGVCKKCKQTVGFDLGNLTVEEAKESLAKQESTQCIAGNHVELMSPMELYEIDWDNPVQDYKTPTEEEFVADLKTKFAEVYPDEDFRDNYTVDGFMMGKCLCHKKDNEDDMKVFDFVHSPQHKRYYVLAL